MRYRGFIIEASEEEDEALVGIYTPEDLNRQFPLEELSLEFGEDIEDMSDQSIAPHVIRHIDTNILELIELQEEARNDVLRHSLGRAISYIESFQTGKELYSILHEEVGLTDEELLSCGFKSLVPYFDKAGYAALIANYMIDKGTSTTETGHRSFSFEDINDRFGVSLPEDKVLLDSIEKALDPSVVAELDTSKDFSLGFYADYCPYIEDGEAPYFADI